jgi:ribA/ribD-fused uncharacterized protein
MLTAESSSFFKTTALRVMTAEMPILKFDGVYRFLSNFFEHDIIYGKIGYGSSEAAFVAQKTTCIMQRLMISQMSAAEAKRFGRKLPLRAGWDDMRDEIMLDILRVKFKSPMLRQWLLATGNAHLEEGNWWGDVDWGVCRGKGLNMLGRLLMQVRREIKQEMTKEQNQ